ncbi:unnamed protein product [Kuraishia capsulata CBS 1993]|uniref:Calcium-channel protein CCH1 n=1 Tax=Kuraishia capsulata CBS 1993 TaxID=1382522 RepID=W6MGL5_9ASCO|nr:uncharacterized protein KUCA_T00000644001 [Kuraishia capsulata CBS 1993]CDK24678.1 unnamed protein product [Kuraishia capsulata CBS 1993]
MSRLHIPEIVEPQEGSSGDRHPFGDGISRRSRSVSTNSRSYDYDSDLSDSRIHLGGSVNEDRNASDLNLPDLHIEDVDEGLNFALGTNQSKGAWLPLRGDSDTVGLLDNVSEDGVDTQSQRPRIRTDVQYLSLDEPDQHGIHLDNLSSNASFRESVYHMDESPTRHSMDTARSKLSKAISHQEDWASQVRKFSQRVSGISQDEPRTPNLEDSEIDMNYRVFDDVLSSSGNEQTDDSFQKPALYGRSLKVFGPNSRFRKTCFKIISASWFEPLMFGLVLATAIILSVQQWNPESSHLGYYQNLGYTAMDWILVPIYVIFTLESFFKIVVHGLWDDSQMYDELNLSKDNYRTFWGRLWEHQLIFFKKIELKQEKLSDEIPAAVSVSADPSTSKIKHSRAYLRYEWNWVDATSVISWWISLFIALNGYNINHGVMVFRSLMCLKIYRLWNITSGTQTVLNALRRAAPELADVSIFLLCFWVFFSIIGVQSFKSSLRRQCVWTNPDDPTDTYVTSQFCGSWLDPDTKSVMDYLESDGSSSGRSKGFACPINSKCISMENPYGGTVSFDNIFHSFEMVFVIISANTFTDIMYDLMDTDSMASSLFFIAAMIILSVWLVNLIVAVIINSFTAMNEQLKEQMKNDNSTIWGSARWNKRTEAYSRFLVKNKRLARFKKLRKLFTLSAVIGMIFSSIRTKNSSTETVELIYKVNCGASIALFVEVMITFALCLPNWRMFFNSLLNWVDLFFGIGSLVIALPVIHEKHETAYAWLTFFQYARCYRVVLGISFLSGLWMKALGNLRALVDLCLFFVLTLFLTSVVMSRLFEGMVPVSEYLDSDMLIMYNLPNVLISLYTITSTENWTSVLYLCQQSANTTFTQVIAATYFILWFIFSNMFILNIFIAIITQNLGVPEKLKRTEQIRQFYRKIMTLSSDEGGVFEILRGRTVENEGVRARINRDQTITRLRQLTDVDLDADVGLPAVERVHDNDLSGLFKDKSKILWKQFEGKLEKNRHIGPCLSFIRKVFAKENDSDTVLFIFAPNNRVRAICQSLVAPPRKPRINGRPPNKIAKNTFMVVMFVATILMVFFSCFWTPLYRREHNFVGSHGRSFYIDVMFACLFTIEQIVKILADGFIGTDNAYLRSTWDALDAVVLASIWVDIVAELDNNSYLSTVVGGLRAIRALRLLTITTLSKQTFQYAIFSGARKAGDAFLVSMSLLLPFSLWGLTIFNGKLGYCLDGESTKWTCKYEYTGEVFNWDVLSPNVYTDPYLHFDSFQMSLASLYEIVSLEGWVDLLENLMNITGFGTPPSTFASPFNGLFIVLFNFCSIVFILNLFVSVIIDNYSMLTGTAFMTEEQLAWNEVRKILSQVKPSKKRFRAGLAPLKRFCYDLTIGKNKYWASFLNVCLFIHGVDLLCEFYPANSKLNAVRYAAYVFSSTGFMVNILMVIYAMGFLSFITNKWNAFSLCVILGAFLMSCASYFVGRNTSFANINKLFLVAMLFFLIPRSDRLSQLLKFASASLPALASLLYTWLVLFLAYAIALNQIFGLSKIGPNGSGNLNCRTVTKCLIMLFKTSFGEGWNYIMDDFTLESPFCTLGSSIFYSDCGNKTFAIILFGSWNIISQYIMLNILISLVVNSFSYVYHSSGPHALITREEIRKFKRAWNKFDPEGHGYISTGDLQPLMRSLDGELSFRVYAPGERIKDIKAKWTYQKSHNPYDLELHHNELAKSFKEIDWQKVRHRKLLYDRFLEESLMSVVSHEGEPMISFTKLLLQIGLYSKFDEASCLTLENFLKRHLLHEKIDNNLRQRKLFATLTMVIDRFRFKNKDYDKLLGLTREENFVVEDPFADPFADESEQASSEQNQYKDYMFSSGVDNPFL